MKTILALINKPEESKNHIKYVVQLASDLQLKVNLLYVENSDTYPMGATGDVSSAVSSTAVSTMMYDTVKSNLQKAKNTLEGILNTVCEELSIAPAIKIYTESGVTSIIAEQYITDKKADIVVLEDKKSNFFWSKDIDNLEIINNVNCPVLIIPPNMSYQQYFNVLYATNYNEGDVPTLKKLINFTEKIKPSVTALHITDNVGFDEKVKKKGFIELVKEQTQYGKVDIKSLLEQPDDNLALLINAYAYIINAKLIVLLKKNRDFLERIFHTGQTKQIIKEAKLPVLIYHENEK